MSCDLSEQDLWSGLDRNAPEVTEHLAHCATCRDRAADFQAGIKAVGQASAPPTPPLPARIGSYVVKRRLGEGGMGIVYEAEQQTPKRLVAIKVVRGGHSADEYRVRLFQREAQTLARLRHPAIAAIYEASCTDAGQHFFVMELVRGVPLLDYVREKEVPRRKRLELFRKVCDAINYAHQRGVIHRDLKPTNILVGPDGNPKILDFGLARITDPDVAVTTSADVGRIMGTLPYMSPEEARGNPDEIDVRTDVFALGVILYELLTGQLPYTVKRTAIPDAVRTICEDPPRRPSALDRALRGDVETIILKALEKEPARRYQSAAMLSEDIERYLTDQPILARRASGIYQLRKFLVRHRLFVTFAAASIVIVAAARVWVDRLDEGRRASTQTLIELQVLEVAVIENKLAETLANENRYSEAEPHYRNAVATFQRLNRDERAGPSLVALGTVLLEQEEPTDVMHEDAETFFLDALVIFDDNPGAWRALRRRALEGLRTLYRDVWDEPEALAEIEAELAALDAAPPAGDADETTPPSTRQ